MSKCLEDLANQKTNVYYTTMSAWITEVARILSE